MKEYLKFWWIVSGIIMKWAFCMWVGMMVWVELGAFYAGSSCPHALAQILGLWCAIFTTHTLIASDKWTDWTVKDANKIWTSK